MDKVYQVIIDRPIGYIDKFGNQYPINYGYVPNLLAGDDEEQDVYIISKDRCSATFDIFRGKIGRDYT